MSKVRALVLLTLVMGLVGVAMANDTPFLQGSATSTQTAVFIPFWAVMPGDNPISTALSVSNILAAPQAIEDEVLELEDLNDTTGTVTFYFWTADGTALEPYETASDQIGNGVLDEEGKLGPGQTLAITVEEILGFLGESPADNEFATGYGWVIGNFDAIQGTVNVYFPGLGFAQSLNMEPTLGNLFFFAGIPLPFGPMLVAD